MHPHIHNQLKAASGFEDRLIDTDELAKLTGTGKLLWARRRVDGTGPPYIQVGGAIRYRLSVVNAWLDKQTRKSASEYPTRWSQKTERDALKAMAPALQAEGATPNPPPNKLKKLANSEFVDLQRSRQKRRVMTEA